MSDDICYATAAEIAARIRRGELTAVEAVDAHLDRIDRYDEGPNAFVTVRGDAAREEARAADEDLAEGRYRGPLHGVPVALKDLFGFKRGVRHTFGSLLFEEFVPDRDAVFVERLEAAGAVVLGKTNTPEFGLGVTTDNRVAGPTRTPFDLARTSGGSSGGSAAALASGFTPLAQGSDAGGSLRIPAAFCGAVGFKPTFGRVPLARPLQPDVFARGKPYVQVGPMARSVEDVALAYDVMRGPHADDPYTVPAGDDDPIGATRRPVDDLRVACSPDLGLFPVEPEVRETVDDAADALTGAVADVRRTSPPFEVTADELLEAFYAYAQVTWEGLLDNLARTYDVDPYGADREKLRTEFVETIVESDREVTAADYVGADRTRTAVFDALSALFESFDVLVAPTTGVPPFEIGSPPEVVDGREIEPLRGWVLTQAFNLSGNPVLSVPGGFTDDGLPIGLQVAGRRFADDDVLAVGAALERQRPWTSAYERHVELRD